HHAGLDHAAPAADVELDEMIEIFRAVDDERGIDGLTGLRGARPPRQHAHALLARKRKRVLGFLHRARRDDAERHDLVVRGVGGIAPARERVELHLAQEMCLEPSLEPWDDRLGHSTLLSAGRKISSRVARGLTLSHSSLMAASRAPGRGRCWSTLEK